jgi:hypothetical protein
MSLEIHVLACDRCNNDLEPFLSRYNNRVNNFSPLMLLDVNWTRDYFNWFIAFNATFNIISAISWRFLACSERLIFCITIYDTKLNNYIWECKYISWHFLDSLHFQYNQNNHRHDIAEIMLKVALNAINQWK